MSSRPVGQAAAVISREGRATRLGLRRVTALRGLASRCQVGYGYLAGPDELRGACRQWPEQALHVWYEDRHPGVGVLLGLPEVDDDPLPLADVDVDAAGVTGLRRVQRLKLCQRGPGLGEPAQVVGVLPDDRVHRRLLPGGLRMRR